MYGAIYFTGCTFSNCLYLLASIFAHRKILNLKIAAFT